LIKTNTIQRAELAKNQADYSKLREVAKGLKSSLKESEDSMKEKDEIIG
jgi:hypothetical protein